MGTVQSSEEDAVYTTYLYGAGSYGTLSSVCFLFAGIFADVMLVRSSLIMGYVFLIISIVLGFPGVYTWTMASKPVTFAYGSFIWNVCTLALQVLSLLTSSQFS
jgi:hypothetical protein